MYRYLALVFFILGVTFAQDNNQETEFFDYLYTNGSLTRPEADIEKIMSSMKAIPESTYQKADRFLKSILPELELYPDTNYVRLHVENAATLMEFFEKAKSDANKEETKKIKKKMKKLGPVFAESLAKIGQSADPSATVPESRQSEINKLKKEHNELVSKSIKELDSNLRGKLKSYSNETIKELKEAGLKLDNVVLRHISKIKILFDVFEATGGAKPSGEFLVANTWVAIAFEEILPLFSQEMIYLAEFANVV